METKCPSGHKDFLRRNQFLQHRTEHRYCRGHSRGLPVADKGGLNVLGRPFLPVVVLLFLGALVAIFLARRSRKHQQRMVELAVVRVLYDNEYLKRQNRYRDLFENDVRDLVLPSSNQDVHHCNNTRWVACGEQVQMTLQHYDEMTDSFGFSEHQCDVDDYDQTQSVVFALTNPVFLGDRFPFGPWSPQPHVQPHSYRGIKDQSDDEPPGVTFIPVTNDLGHTHRKFRDHNSLRTTWVLILEDAIAPP